MSKTSNAVKRKYNSKNYKQKVVNLSISDSPIIEEHCKLNDVSFNRLVYDLLIKHLAENGVQLEGTVTMQSGNRHDNR